MIGKKLALSSLAVLVAVLPGCWPERKKAESHETSVSKNLYVLNVLDPEQYNECHIPGSINVPFDKVAEFAQGIDKNAELVLYCSNCQCTASTQAAKQLKELGFERVYAYEGGIAAWYQSGLPVEGTVAQGSPASDYLQKAVERPAELCAEVAVITTEALREKLMATGILPGEQSSTAAPVA